MQTTTYRLALATVVAGLVTIAACSPSPAGTSDFGGATTTAPVTVTTTTPTTVLVTNTVTASATTTATQTRTATQTVTLTPEPAGTRTVVQTTQVTRTATETVTAQPPAPAGSFDDGTYLVGKDIKPGTYRASDPNPVDGLCYWEIRSRDGEIADNGINDGVMFVGSKAFSVRTRDCGTWTPAG